MGGEGAHRPERPRQETWWGPSPGDQEVTTSRQQGWPGRDWVLYTSLAEQESTGVLGSLQSDMKNIVEGAEWCLLGGALPSMREAWGSIPAPQNIATEVCADWAQPCVCPGASASLHS